MTNKQFFCFTEYAATCEGWHVWLSVELAKDVEEAKTKHAERFKFHDFFKHGTKVYPSTDRESIVPILKQHFSEEFITFMGSYEYNAPFTESPNCFYCFGCDFAFHFYVNRS